MARGGEMLEDMMMLEGGMVMLLGEMIMLEEGMVMLERK